MSDLPVSVDIITKYIFLDSKPQKADLAFVFGTRFEDALRVAFNLYKNGLVPKILVSGGLNKYSHKIEAEEMARELIAMGVPAENILSESKSTNTLENVLFSRQVIEDKIGFNKISKIVIVAKHYHSRRDLMTLKKHFPKHISYFLVTYNVYGFTKHNWFNTEKGKEEVMAEWDKIHLYLKKDDIEEI